MRRQTTARRQREPRRLRRGKAFEAEEKRAWHAKPGEDLAFEKPMVDAAGKRGRLDIFVAGGGALAGIGEVKATDWDRVRMERVRMLARRHAGQVWRYIDAHTSQGLDVSPGLIYPKPPRSARKRALVESVLGERFIQCVWRCP